MALNNAQYDEIIRQYNAKQIRNQHIVEDRKNEVYAKNARLKEIDDTISSCSVAQAKKLLLGDDAAALDELKKQIASLCEEKSVILASLGYPEDYLFLPMTVRTAGTPAISATNAVTVSSRRRSISSIPSPTSVPSWQKKILIIFPMIIIPTRRQSR